MLAPDAPGRFACPRHRVQSAERITNQSVRVRTRRLFVLAAGK